MSHSAILCEGFGLAPAVGEGAAVCALCGLDTDRGVPLQTLLKPTASEILDVFRWPSGIVCGPCAACYAEARLLTGSLFATRSMGLKPTVARCEGRTRWLDLLGDGSVLAEENVAVITSNTKRRLWPHAVVSQAPLWRPLFVHGEAERLLTIDVPVLFDCLAVVGEVYRAGFSKTALETTLLHSLSVVDTGQLLAYENELRRWRGTDEFLVSLFIVQKE